jgi:hypothetical protein
VALPATIRRFDIALADADRGVYQQLSWRVAQHPSESDRYLVARVLARALEHAEGARVQQEREAFARAFTKISRFSCREVPCVLGSTTARDRALPRDVGRERVAFRLG